MSSSRTGINFAPYEPPPDAPIPSSSTSRLSKTNPFAFNSGSTSSSSAGSRAKSPWFSGVVGSYQSGARTSDLASNNQNAISSNSYGNAAAGSSAGGGGGGDVLWDVENGNTGGARYSSGPSEYETAYGWRVDIEAGAAYVLGPLLAVLLLIMETKNDYVRFHAWQSLLLGAGLAMVHLLLLWSRFFTWTLFLVDLGAFGSLAYRAFKDGDTLQRYYLPRIGELAARWTEEE